MQRIEFLRIGLYALGVAALAIGASMFLLGPERTGAFFAALLAATTGMQGDIGDLAGVNVDNELRFYAVFWFAYGWLTLSAARILPDGIRRARLLLGLFFLGGVGRALSWLAVGAPHPLFVILMGIELALPPILLMLSLGAEKKA